MALTRLLIDWPLTPYTGWGSYGIQLAQALIADHLAKPVISYQADRSPQCDPHWLMRLDELEKFSAALIEHFRLHPNEEVHTNCQLALSPLGNQIPPLRCLAEHQIGVTFFERSQLDTAYVEDLNPYSLIITGSKWNQNVLQKAGFSSSALVHQGVDITRFHAIPVPRLLNRPFVIFAGGKLEARKGQDIIIAAFKAFLKHCPEAILIASWGNLGNIGIDTISLSKHVEGAPTNGNEASIFDWLQLNNIPASNVLVPPIMANPQLPNLIKQADAAVFTSRCEGGTNLMAMETLACGIPTLLSANTGHLDLLEMGMAHAIPIGSSGVGNVPESITLGYGGDKGGLWGESDPEELVEWWLRLWRDQETWRNHGQHGAQAMTSMSWQASMQALINLLIEKELLPRV